MDFNKILHGGYCRKTNLNINFKHDRTKDDVTVNEFPQFSIQRQVENNWLPWQHLRTKENFKTCKIILNGVKKKLVKFLYSILSRLGVIEKSSPFRRIPPPPPRLDRVKTP